MKKLLLSVAVVAMVLSGCQKINDALDELDGRLDKLEQETIPTIDEQIAAINTTLGNLDAMDKELKGYIDGLTATATNLQEQIDATNTKIEEVKSALQGEIETAKANVIAQLEAAKEELENELATINATIVTLQAKDEELDKKIADLKTYVDTELTSTENWVNATFATLEQYNALVSEIATIKEQIKAINQSIADLETKLTTKINEDIATAVSTLSADIQQKVSEITTAYTNAVKTAKEEITSAYTSAIQTVINALDTSLKSWVGEALSNYYTIAEIEAKIIVLQTAITEGDNALQEELNKLKTQLETTAAEITDAYKKAIKEAIETNNGVIDTKIASEIATVNQRIDSEVAAINAKITEIEARLDNIEAKIAELLARIQSVSYIPEYADGKATVKFNDVVSHVTLDFEVSPKDAVVELAKVWKDAVSLKAVYTQTRAVSFIDMPITKFEIDETNGVITVTASGENLSEAFFAGTQSASVRLSISDGNNSIVSEYIPLVGKEVTDEIWYTSTDGAVVTPYATDVFGANIVSNTYENGKGVIKFDGDVTSIGEGAFYSCYSLTSITIPDSVTSIGGYAFDCCTSLTSVTIPDSVTSIGREAFNNCTSLTSVTIPDSVTSIGYRAFFFCTSLTSVTIPDSVTSIGREVFYNCTSLTSVTIGKSVTSIGAYAFVGCTSLTRIDIADLSAWCKISFGDSSANPLCNGVKLYLNGSELTDITIPSGITEIKDYAFFNCTSLKSITIPDSVTSIGYASFAYCVSISEIEIPENVEAVGYAAFVYCNSLSRFIGKYASLDGRYLSKNGELLAFAPSGLSEYILPDTITSIGNEVFNGCSELKSITIPNSVTSIGEGAFFNCASLTSVTIGNSVTSIGLQTFSDCTSLTSVTIGNSVTSIGALAFFNCTSLKSITIPDSVTSIGEEAFYECTSLKTVYCKPITPPTAVADVFDFWLAFGSNASGRKIYVPRNSVSAYKSAQYWSVYADYIVGYDF